jgi:hypothetical protein
LTTNTTNLGGSGTISYQWKRGTTNIGTNSNTYTIRSTDAGSAITVTVTRTDNSGSVTSSATAAITLPAFNVSNVSEWNTAVNSIRNGGNNQAYTINVTDAVSVSASPDDENVFSSVTGITVTIQGSGTLSLSVNGCLLRIGAGQTVILRDNVTLRGRSANNSPVAKIMSGGVLRMEGSALVTGNSNIGGVHIDGGTFIMQDSASVSGN